MAYAASQLRCRGRHVELRAPTATPAPKPPAAPSVLGGGGDEPESLLGEVGWVRPLLALVDKNEFGPSGRITLNPEAYRGAPILGPIDPPIDEPQRPEAPERGDVEFESVFDPLVGCH
jgi:hypothetical protein